MKVSHRVTGESSRRLRVSCKGKYSTYHTKGTYIGTSNYYQVLGHQQLLPGAGVPATITRCWGISNYYQVLGHQHLPGAGALATGTSNDHVLGYQQLPGASAPAWRALRE
jgi:hypothetical protein